jgi:hypothetical protein
MNFLAIAETLIPVARSSRTSCFCLSLSVEGRPRAFPSDFGALETGLRPLDQQIALELGDGVEHGHGHRAGRAGEICAAERKAIDAHAHFGQSLNRGADVDRIAAEAIKLSHD